MSNGTRNQQLGEAGVQFVVKKCRCMKCKREKTLRRLMANFKCADLICDFCGYLAQVKTANVLDPETLPSTILGAAWSVQKERMDAGIYFPWFIVLARRGRPKAIYYLPMELQGPELFVPRRPLSSTARRSGWQGYRVDFRRMRVKNGCVRML